MKRSRANSNGQAQFKRLLFADSVLFQTEKLLKVHGCDDCLEGLRAERGRIATRLGDLQAVVYPHLAAVMKKPRPAKRGHK